MLPTDLIAISSVMNFYLSLVKHCFITLCVNKLNSSTLNAFLFIFNKTVIENDNNNRNVTCLKKFLCVCVCFTSLCILFFLSNNINFERC